MVKEKEMSNGNGNHGYRIGGKFARKPDTATNTESGDPGSGRGGNASGNETNAEGNRGFESASVGDAGTSFDGGNGSTGSGNESGNGTSYGNGSGDGGGGSGKRKRGRPRGSRNRQGSDPGHARTERTAPDAQNEQTESVDDDDFRQTPKRVKLSADVSKADEKEVVLVRNFAKQMFNLPANTGFGEHWELQNTEADFLARQIVGVMNALGKRRKGNIQRIMTEYLPYVGLTVAIVNIIFPRIAATIEEGKKKNEFRGNAQTSQKSGNATANPVNTTQTGQTDFESLPVYQETFIPSL